MHKWTARETLLFVMIFPAKNLEESQSLANGETKVANGLEKAGKPRMI